MSFKKTLLFLLILAGVFSYIYFVEFPNEEAKKASVSLLGGAIPKEIREVSIVNNNENITLTSNLPQKSFSKEEKAKLRLEPLSKEEQASWKIKGMESVPVDGTALSTYLSTLADLNLGEPLPKDEIGSDLKPFGLEAPTFSISIKTDGKEKKALFGKESEYLSKRYVKFEGDDAIYLVQTYQLSSLSKTKEDFRRKKLLELTEPELETLILKRDGNEIELTQDPIEHSWKITKPILAVAGRLPIGSLIKELNELSATTLAEFGDAVAEEKYGLNNPDVEITIKEKGKDPYKVKIARKDKSTPAPSSADEDVYLRVSNLGFVGETKPNPSFRVAPALKDLREKNQFVFNVYKTNKAIISEKGKPDLVLEKKNDEWWVGDKKGDGVFVNDYLQKLSRTEAIRFPESSISISDPVMTINVFLKDGGSKVLKIGDALPEGGRLAHAVEMFVMDSKAYEGLIPRVETLLPVENPTSDTKTP